MRRADLEHLIRAAAGITNEYEFIIIGSQSILGSFLDAPNGLRMRQRQSHEIQAK